MRFFRRFSRRPYKVKVLYEGGAILTFRCKSFTIWDNKVEWENARPNPLRFGISKVIAVWEVY